MRRSNSISRAVSSSPKDASEDFGAEFIDKILPSLISDDTENIIKRATICKDGNLTLSFEYLRDYLNRN